MLIKCHVLHCCIFIRKNNSNQNIFSAYSFLGVLNWLPPVFVYECVACRGMVRAATRITRELSGGYFYILAGCSSCSSTAGQAAINWPDTGHQPSHSFLARAGHNQCQCRGLLWKHEVILHMFGTLHYIYFWKYQIFKPITLVTL